MSPKTLGTGKYARRRTRASRNVAHGVVDARANAHTEWVKNPSRAGARRMSERCDAMWQCRRVVDSRATSRRLDARGRVIRRLARDDVFHPACRAVGVTGADRASSVRGDARAQDDVTWRSVARARAGERRGCERERER